MTILISMSGMAPASSAWNPSDVAVQDNFSWTFSESNRLATSPTNPSHPNSSGSVRGEIAHTTGKRYFEIQAVAVPHTEQNWGGGICNSAATMAPYWQNNGANTQISFHASGQIWKDGLGYQGFTSALAAGGILGFAVDMDAKTVQIFKNNVSQITVGFAATSMKPYFTAFFTLPDCSARLKTTLASFTYTPPTGYTEWG